MAKELEAELVRAMDQLQNGSKGDFDLVRPNAGDEADQIVKQAIQDVSATPLLRGRS